MLATIMQGVDNTIANVALPHIQGALSASQDQVAWVLTQHYSWRWVFYINLPFGLLAALGILIFIHDRRPAHRELFDFFGFASLSVGIGALQLLLDRGQLADWFHSGEIWIEATVSAVAFYLFIVHTVTATDRSFLNRELLKSPNFVTGTILMFLIGG